MDNRKLRVINWCDERETTGRLNKNRKHGGTSRFKTDGGWRILVNE